MATPRYKIKIKKQNCADPIECGIKCVKVCPYAILCYHQKSTPPPGVAPDVFKIGVAFTILCNGCNRCVEACERNAILITHPEKKNS